jgi:hypothetical protein
MLPYAQHPGATASARGFDPAGTLKAVCDSFDRTFDTSYRCRRWVSVRWPIPITVTDPLEIYSQSELNFFRRDLPQNVSEILLFELLAGTAPVSKAMGA